MPGLKRKPLILKKKEREYLLKVIKTRDYPAPRVRRAKILLLFSEGKKITEIASRLHTTRSIIDRCLDKAHAYGVRESLADLPRSGRVPSITDNAKSWILSLIRRSPRDPIGVESMSGPMSFPPASIRKKAAAETISFS